MFPCWSICFRGARAATTSLAIQLMMKGTSQVTGGSSNRILWKSKKPVLNPMTLLHIAFQCGKNTASRECDLPAILLRTTAICWNTSSLLGVAEWFIYRWLNAQEFLSCASPKIGVRITTPIFSQVLKYQHFDEFLFCSISVYRGSFLRIYWGEHGKFRDLKLIRCLIYFPVSYWF